MKKLTNILTIIALIVITELESLFFIFTVTSLDAK